jgi:GTP-binding protein Era
VIFVDSPGWHQPLHPLGRRLVEVAKGVIEEVDVLVAVISATTGLTQEDEWLFDQVRHSRGQKLLAVNKVDKVHKEALLPLLETCGRVGLFEELIPISATGGDNMVTLLDQMIQRLPEGPRWYEEGQVTDQTTEQLIREFIREQVLQATREEVPHAVAVALEQVERKERLTVIRATILVEREGQKAIVIGRQGRMLKQIGTAARRELERLLGRKVFLELWVKVVEGWRSNAALLRELGYDS